MQLKTSSVQSQVLSTLYLPSFLAFMDNPNYLYPKHIELIESYLVKVAKGELKRLIVSMPPRHGKSEYISKYFPAWYLINYPDNRIILTSYEADFAASWGRKSRNLIAEFGKLKGINLSSDSKAADHFSIEGHKGEFVTAGVGGAITGKGADIIIIDDPVKNAETSMSSTYQEKIKDWFDSTAYTRLEPNGAIIIIMTRWNQKDLAGKLIEENRDNWTVINLPAFANENDLLGRAIGEPLWKERFNEESLLRIKENLGNYWFSALYQGNPVPAEGLLFKQEHRSYYHSIPPDAKGVIYCDPNLSKKGKGDTTCIIKLLFSPSTQKYYIAEAVVKSFSDTGELLNTLLKMRGDDSRVVAIGFDGSVSQESHWSEHFRNYGRLNNTVMPIVEWKKYNVNFLSKNAELAWSEHTILCDPSFEQTEYGKRFFNQLFAFSGKTNNIKDDAPDAMICAVEFLFERGYRQRKQAGLPENLKQAFI